MPVEGMHSLGGRPHRLDGAVCLVTGGSSGVGKATAMELARLGASVVILCRDRARGEEAVRDIQRRSGNRSVELACADLSLQSEVRRFAAEFSSRHRRLKVLANCAGMVSLKHEETPEGIDRTLAVDYFSHFLLTNLLLDLLRQGAPARVVTVVGGLRVIRRVHLRLEDFPRSYGFAAYVQAGLARALFAFELSRRLPAGEVASNGFDPGLVRSHLDRGLPLLLRIPVRMAQAFMSGECPTAVYAASSPEVVGVSGKLFVGRRAVELPPHPEDADLARGLWEESARLTGLRR